MGLPSGYTRLEYIQSTGNQYFDTGYKPKHNTRVVDEVSDFNEKGYLYGVRDRSSLSSERQFGLYRNSTTTIRADYFGTNASTSLADATEKTTIDQNANVTTVYGKTITNSAVSSGQCTNTLFLFALNNVGSPAVNGSLKRYSYKVYEGSTLVHSYIPSRRDSDGSIGLYDDVNRTFGGSGSATPFIAGPVVALSGNRTLIEATSCEVVEGTVMINGTLCAVVQGTAMIDGTLCAIGLQSETSGGSTISFSVFDDIAGETFEFTAEEGMTWADFVSSSYNSGGTFKANDPLASYYCSQFGWTDLGYSDSGNEVFLTDTIVAGEVYVLLI